MNLIPHREHRCECNAGSRFTNFIGINFWWRAQNSPVRSIESKASIKSRKTAIAERMCGAFQVAGAERQFWFIKSRPRRSPAWCSRILLSQPSVKQSGIIEAETLVAIGIKLILRRLPKSLHVSIWKMNTISGSHKNNEVYSLSPNYYGARMEML